MNDTHGVIVSSAAERDLKKFKKDKAALKQFGKLLKSLKENVRPTGVEKMKDAPNLWRIRRGNYRVVYAIEPGEDYGYDHVVIVVVLAAQDRKEVYKDLGALAERLAGVDQKKFAEELKAKLGT